jgi:predicted kinase
LVIQAFFYIFITKSAMIRLVSLLREAIKKPKAIFLAGPAGSGKSTISKQLLPSNISVINVDDTYEQMLKDTGLGMDMKNFTPDQLSQAAKLMAVAQKQTREKFEELIKNLKNVIVDGTGAASNPIRKKKEQLEALGYDTMMLMLYVSPTTSLERNQKRERSLLPGIVLRSWRDVNLNINTYKDMFGENRFILINNNPKDAEMQFSPEEVKRRFFDTSSAKGKPKTPEEIAKAKADIEKLNQDIQQMVDTLPQFDTLSIAKTKINQFLS